MSQNNKVPDFLQIAKDLRQNASRYASTESVNFFKECFVKQGWTGTSFVPWKQAGSPLAGKRTLFRNGDLMRSVRKVEASAQRVVVQSDLEYSEIHNEGGEITVTAQMKKYFWAKYYEFLGKVKTSKGGTATALSASNKAISSKAKFCKAMALKPVGSKIKIDRRQYMGESKILMQQFEHWYCGNVETVFKNNLNAK